MPNEHPNEAHSPSASQQPSSSGGFGETALPQRKKLGHSVPSWLSDQPIFFITVCCAKRGINALATPEVSRIICESLLHRQATGLWWVRLFVLMPDHAHGLITFARETEMKRTVTAWKRYIARLARIEWQRDFFDHRVRHDESLTDKWHYIRQNPVRGGLVDNADRWPFTWENGIFG